MKQIIIFSVFVAIASAQFSCDSCDTAGARVARTGCRVFCYGSEGGDALSRTSFLAVFNRDKDTSAGMTRPRFVEIQRAVAGFCDDEANVLFDGIASNAGGNPELIEEADINEGFDLFEFLTGLSAIDKETFAFFYEIGYADFGNDNCPSGF